MLNILTWPTADSANTYATINNTAPSNCIDGLETTLLRSGIDSLYLSYHGELSDEADIRLAKLKNLAQSKDPESAKLAQLSIGNHLFEVKDKGGFPFKYILVDRWFHIKLSGQGAIRTPLAHVKISSEILTFEGPNRVVEELTEIIESLGLIERPPTVSRVDLCTDFTTTTDIASIKENEWVTRAKTIGRYTVKRRFSGNVIGIGGNILARLYDKTLEILGSDKSYMLDVWKDLDWDVSQSVWRLEFQFRREVLRQLNIETFDDLMSGLGGLWAYASTDWLRLVIPSPHDKTQSRWPTHSMWAKLQMADWGTELGYTRKCTPTGQPPSDRSLFVNGLSGITSFMAREGITDPYVGATEFYVAARNFHTSREHYIGLSFEEYVEQKVAVKAKRYNSLENLPPEGEPHPADAAVTREYERRSNGE